MAESRSTSNPLEYSSSAFFLHHSENHSSVIVTPKLMSLNFSSWRRSLLDLLFLPWIRCKNLLVAWLLRSFSPLIASTIFYLENAKQICDKLHQRFLELDDSRNMEELRIFKPLPSCNCGKCNSDCFYKFIEIQQKDYVFKFLNGLNDTYQGSRSQVINMKPFTTLAKADIMCFHCGKNRHVKAQCYKIVSFPADFKFIRSKENSNDGGGNSGNFYKSAFVQQISKAPTIMPTSDNVNLFNLSKDQMQRLMALLGD
ncbi:hypothetical protein MANES_08G077385v8 [Manihot esculenta]|uniref:Uncharacterized protein n=1 Tax=Manihot esculenta TaxID=3983 RepID=A0ACB7HA11_MANES|nr:hypothetical protein MANES_08G077385v8 [Manihot esculenta]